MFIVDGMMARSTPRLKSSRWLCVDGSFLVGKMTGFDLQMDSAMVVWSGVSQGLGRFRLRALAAPLSATLTPALRNEGTAIFSLTRNLGSSIVISAVVNTC